MTISPSRCVQRAPWADQRSPAPDSRFPVMVDAPAITLPKPAVEGAISREFSGMEMTSTAQCKFLRKAPRAKLATALLSMLCSLGVARAATEVQMAVDNDSAMCEHFRKALVADHVATMTRDQLCQYNFAQKHAGKGNSYFQRLNWQPVPGDPVALTMKIFDVNHPPSTDPAIKGRNRARRADVLSYAELQNRNHALTIEIAPFSVTQVTADAKLVRVAGYVMSSRGAYCGKNDDDGSERRRQSIAFYTDSKVTHSLPIFYYDDDEAVEPLEIRGKSYAVTIMDGGMYSPVYFNDLTGTFSITIDRLFVDDSGSNVLTTNVCGLTYVRKP